MNNTRTGLAFWASPAPEPFGVGSWAGETQIALPWLLDVRWGAVSAPVRSGTRTGRSCPYGCTPCILFSSSLVLTASSPDFETVLQTLCMTKDAEDPQHAVQATA